MNQISGAGGISPSSRKPKALKAKQLRAQQRIVNSKVKSADIRGKNITSVPKNQFEQIDKRAQKRGVKATKMNADSEEAVEATGATDEAEARFNKGATKELNEQLLLALKHSINDDDSVEEILAKVLKIYPDQTLADDAFDYLLDTSSGELGLKILQAKNLLNERFPREIIAGRNILPASQTEKYSHLGTPTELRDVYREVTGKESTALTLFDELTTEYDYDEMKEVIQFLLHSLGLDLRSKGPSIDKPLLKQLVDETRSLQAILGVHDFFAKRMPLIQKLFHKNGLILPVNLTFDVLTKYFISLFNERYVTMEKVLQLSAKMGISEDVIAQIIIFTTMRDAIRGIAPKFYKSRTQFEDFIDAFLGALESLEEIAEEEEYYTFDDLNIEDDNIKND